METPRTLLQTPPAWEHMPAPDGRRPHVVRGPRRAARDARPPAQATVLGRYRLLERLGSGGFGEVWCAHDELLHRHVALKRIVLGPDGDSERATREALAAARLSHPAIVALYEACAVDDAFYLISELVDGATLGDLIAEDALEDDEVIEIGLALTGALAHAHARGVIHRDIKPHNVLVPHRPQGPVGAAKLTDFGGASLAGEDALTRTGDVLGTLAYMAPEQSDGREVGEEADLYALALVLYEAFSGINPVRGPTPAATARRIGTELEPLENLRGDLPRGLTRGLDAALAPAPADRGSLELLETSLNGAVERGPRRSRRGAAPRLVVPRLPAGGDVHEDDLAPLGPPPAAAPQPRSSPAPSARGRARGEEDAVVADEWGEAARPRRRALPRTVWIGGALALIVWQSSAGRPGLGLLLLAGLVPLIALPRRAGPSWMSCAVAAALGMVGLAGAFPAAAGQASRWRERAGLAALGYWWLVLAEPLLGRRLWLGPPPGTPARSVWEGSIHQSAVHVVGPALTLGVLLGAALWAASAAVLPWVVRGRAAALDLVAAVMWSAALVTAAPLLDGGLSAHAAHPSPRGAVLGAVLGAIIAVAARAVRGPA